MELGGDAGPHVRVGHGEVDEHDEDGHEQVDGALVHQVPVGQLALERAAAQVDRQRERVAHDTCGREGWIQVLLNGVGPFGVFGLGI